MTERAAGAAGPDAAGDLLDVNVRLALAIEEHPHHGPAASYRGRHAGATRFFCRVSALSLVRLLTHPRLMADRPLSLARAWALYRGFASLPGVAMIDEPVGLDADLEALVLPRLAPRLFTDAYFAALARRARLRRVAFDSDFERFHGLTMLRLAADEP